MKLMYPAEIINPQRDDDDGERLKKEQEKKTKKKKTKFKMGVL